MKKILENKKTLIIIPIVLLVVLVISLVIINLNKPVKVVCEREKQFVLGIDSDEDLTIMLNKENKISRIIVDKSIELDNYYQQFETHRNAIFNHMKDAYKYLPEKNIKLIAKKIR